jgi:hypothetical protein
MKLLNGFDSFLCAKCQIERQNPITTDGTTLQRPFEFFSLILFFITDRRMMRTAVQISGSNCCWQKLLKQSFLKQSFQWNPIKSFNLRNASAYPHNIKTLISLEKPSRNQTFNYDSK